MTPPRPIAPLIARLAMGCGESLKGSPALSVSRLLSADGCRSARQASAGISPGYRHAAPDPFPLGGRSD